MTPKGEDGAFRERTQEEEKTRAFLEVGREKQSTSEKRKGVTKKTSRAKGSKRAKPKTPRTKKPAGMSLEEWQIALRREFGAAQNFKMKNIGTNPIFSEFIVENSDTGGRYSRPDRASGGKQACLPELPTGRHGHYLFEAPSRYPSTAFLLAVFSGQGPIVWASQDREYRSGTYRIRSI